MAQLPASKKTGSQFRKACISIPFLNSNAATLDPSFYRVKRKNEKNDQARQGDVARLYILAQSGNGRGTSCQAIARSGPGRLS
jgi:hypothetical protein